MGFWFNNLITFEGKRNRTNNLVLNFSYVRGIDDNGNSADYKKIPDKIKVYIPKKVRIPTWFLTPPRAEEIVKGLKENPNLENLVVERRHTSKFEVLEVEVPNNPNLLDELHDLGFRTGDYAKMLKYGGFYPDRKVTLEESLLADIGERDEITLPNLDCIKFGNFLTLNEARNLPYVIIDIEKPLWRSKREKELYNLRKKLLKAKGDEKTPQRRRIIKKVEARLPYYDPEIEGANLYDGAFNADISYVGTTWVFGNQRINELYVIDPKREVDEEERDGFKILKFKDEAELVNALKLVFKERKPVVAIGHNQVYDYTQLKFAADDHKLVFDPAIKDIKPRRDFVRDFLQRQREDLIYIDTLWFSRIKHPYLNQRSFETSFKLGDLATYLGIDFKKSLTHKELRKVEFRRLAGKTPEIRKEAARQMLEYTLSDVGVTEKIFHILDPWPTIVAMKEVLPFCTYTELAFSTNVMTRLHEYNHFSNAGNLVHSGFKRGQTQTELQMFKKKYPGLKKARLKQAGLEKAPRGNYENVTEYYVSVESWLLDLAFSINPELREVHNKLKDTNEFVFFQYLRSYMMQVLSDYFHANISEDVEAAGRRFYARYKFGTEKVRERIKEGYRNLAADIRNSGMTYLDHKGDYIFVQGQGEIRGARKIRTLKTFERK